jgi:predicted transcriptional regulator
MSVVELVVAVATEQVYCRRPGGKVREISREAHRRRGITRYLAQLRDNALFRACSRVAEKQRVYRRNFAVYRAMSINTFHEGN